MVCVWTKLILVHIIPTLGQYLRLQRNCTNEQDYEHQAATLQVRFLERGYSRKCVNWTFHTVKQKSRHDLIYRQKCKQDGDDSIRLITKYSTQHEHIKNILQRHWPLLREDSRKKNLIAEHSRITFRGAKS